MAATLTLRRRQARHARPAEVTDDSRLRVRQELVAGDADTRQQKVKRSGPAVANRCSQTLRV
jgi:hypothetical protein